MLKKLKEDVWSNKKYYELAREGSHKVEHCGMQLLHKLAKDAGTVLDLGCGEGTRLSSVSAKYKGGIGIDISEVGINMAKKAFPQLHFQVGNLEKLPFRDNSFDMVYSAYVLEHLDMPENVINEAVRVTSHGGRLVFIAPNYGAPNRSSPPFKGSRLKKFFTGIINDLANLIYPSKRLNWNKVDPVITNKQYQSDWDVTVEPYVGGLITYLKKKGLSMEVVDTCWHEEQPNARNIQKFFRLLGDLKIYPFSLWGPHLVIAARKP